MATDPDENSLPGVSYIMPVLNEVAHVRAAIDSLLAQDYAGPFEVTVALGPSDDGTTELLAEMKAADPRISVVENAAGSTPAGLNLAINASSLPVVVRVDAHSVLPVDYTRIAVETMLRTGADNVGGIMDAQGITPFEQAVARAYGSRIGLGGTKLHLGGEEGPAETVYLGVFRRESLMAAGLFDEGIRRGQDWELNRRIRESGGTVWFTPSLQVVYRPRPRLRDLAKQFFSTGVWRGELARRYTTSNSIRYFAPPVLVVALVLGLLFGIAGVAQALTGAAPWMLLGFTVPAAYVIGIVVATLLVTRGLGPRASAWFLIVLPTIHFCWGIGFILGALSLARDLENYTGR
ncbi:glycosyltransferase family 2 protein [Microbacterium sp. STN6]|uniref:glycosyltransferase family 2 protein n=1 Tax=Microbacterium sp. STN6 TaxID=2995588 RepID=UPI002260D3BE|nr:glycosyltransferase family 2 protein [Microbacterium sp. STN6]MCX7521978.1 glycosyltransferase family 2 protein [Microbacterium sp. STN6]